MERHSLKYFHMMMVGAGALVLAGCGEQPWAQEEAALPTARERVDQATGERDGDKKSENLSQPKAEVSVGGEEFVGLAGVPVKVQADPEAILEALSTGKIDRANRTEELRKVVFYMECLVLAREPSLPAIRKFLGRNEDLEFGFNSNAMKWQYQPKLPAKADPKAGAKKTTTRTRGHYVMTTEFVLPVSLRLGLFEVLARIGGNNAEKILADALEESGRGIEIATLDRLLANLAGEKYKDEVLGAVHQLLADPLEVPSPTKLDGYSRKYLFSILTKYRDETFAELAQHLIVKDNGSIDNDVVSYLNLTLGDRAMPLFANALNDPQLDPRWAGTLSSYVLKHVGSNAVADAFFHKVMTDDKLAGLRRNAFSALRYGAEKDVLQRRLDLLKEYKEKFAENRTIAPTMSWVERSLKQQLDPNYKPPQLQWKGQTLRLQGLNGGGGSLILPSGGSGTTYFKSAGEGGVIRAYRIEGNGGAGEIRVEPSIGKDGALSIRIQPPKK